MSETDYTCPLCSSEAEVIGTDGHWLQLECTDCDCEFERAAYDDIGGVSIEDLSNAVDFTD